MKRKANFYWYLWSLRGNLNGMSLTSKNCNFIQMFVMKVLNIFPNFPARKTFWKNALKFFIFSLFIPHLSLSHFSPQLFYVSWWHWMVRCTQKCHTIIRLYRIDRLITVLTYEIFHMKNWKFHCSLDNKIARNIKFILLLSRH